MDRPYAGRYPFVSVPCFHPLQAWQLESGEVVFAEKGRVRRPLVLPCGQCHGCRLERSRQWAVRIMHEASLWDASSFVTLTYDDEHLPVQGQLVYKHFQLFMRRLRKARADRKVRFFMCGEYGEKFQRPHFHACLFNVEFPDRELFSTAGGNRLYTSAELSRLWTDGFASVGELSFDSAAYVARYCMKKVNGKLADDHYRRTDLITGEMVEMEPEFSHMSLKPGIAGEWFDRYWKDVVVRDEVHVNGTRAKPPRFYDKRLLVIDADKFDEIAYERYLKSVEFQDDTSPERLRVREEVARARSNLKIRSYEV